MAVKLLPGFKTLSEFGAYHGDCGECATLGVLHSLDPQRFPLTLNELNHLTSDAIAHSEADASLSGGMNIPHLDAMLTRLGIAHTTVGYGAFTLDRLHSDLKANAGAHGVIVEWSKGGALPGDESVVQLHYSSCGGIDTGPAGDGVGGAYLWCDGDNSATTKNDGGSAPIRYTWSQVVNAAPIGYISVSQQAVKAMITIERNSAGHVTGAHDESGARLGQGFAELVDAQHWTGANIALSERYIGAVALAVLTNDQTLTYSAAHGTQAHAGADLAATLPRLCTAIDTLTAQVHDLQNQQPPTPQAPTLAQALQVVGAAMNGKQVA